MSDYAAAVDILETELSAIEAVFRGLTDEEWATPTRLEPLDPSLDHWSLFELAGHFDISIGLTRMLIADPQDGQVGRDRASFFIFPRPEVAPIVYDYAYTMVEGKTPADMPDVLHETFSKTIEESRANPPDLIGPGYYALMTLGEFVPSRVVEAVVHGLDLTDPLEREPAATPEAIAMTAAILDDVLARRTVPAARLISQTISTGSERRRVGRSTTQIHGCRSSVETSEQFGAPADTTRRRVRHPRDPASQHRLESEVGDPLGAGWRERCLGAHRDHRCDDPRRPEIDPEIDPDTIDDEQDLTRQLDLDSSVTTRSS